MSIKALNSVAGFSVGENPNIVILANGDIVTNNANLTGNISTYAVLSDNYFYSNGVPYDFSNAAGNTGELQFNTANDLDASSKLTFDKPTGLLSVDGNISARYFIGNVTGNISGNLVVPGINQSIIYNKLGNAGGSSAFTFDEDTSLVTVVGNIAAYDVTGGNTVSAVNLAGSLVTALQPNITQVGLLSNLTVTGNVSAANAQLGNLASANYFSGDGSLLANLTGANVTGTVANAQYSATAGTVLTAVQTNITQLGTLANLSITGNLDTVTDINATGTIAAAELTATGNIIVQGLVSGDQLSIAGAATVDQFTAGTVQGNLIPTSDNTYTLGNSSQRWNKLSLSSTGIQIGTSELTDVAGVLTTANANIATALTTGNVTVTGNLTAQRDVYITGNLTVSGSTEYIDVTNLSVKDPIIQLGGSPEGQGAEAYDGLDRGLLLQNYKPDGSGPLDQFFGWKNADSEFIAVSNVASSAGETIVANEYANIRANTFIGNLAGQVTASNQPQITKLGNLVDLTVDGLTTANTVTANLLTVSGVTYPVTDGLTGQVLTTDGSGSLFFDTPVTSELHNGTSNVKVDVNGNVTVSVAGVANVLTVTDLGADLVGNFTAGTISAATSVQLGITNIGWATATTNTISPNQLIAQIPATAIRGVEFFIKGEEIAGAKYSVETIAVVHNGSSVDYSKYGAVTVGGLTGVLSVTYADDFINLLVSAGSSNTTVWTMQYKTI